MYYNGFYGEDDTNTDSDTVIDTSSQYAVDPSEDVQNVDQKIPTTTTTASDTTTTPKTKDYTWLYIGGGLLVVVGIVIFMLNRKKGRRR